MDWLERLTPRRVAFVLAAAAVLRFGLPYYHYPVAWYMHWRYPPLGGPSVAGQDILAESEKREEGRVEARYRRVLAQLEQARAQGLEVAGLENKARAAMALNTAQYRRSAVRMLSEVELSVPRPKVQYIPMGPTEAPGEQIEPDAPAKPVEDLAAKKPARKAKGRKR